MDETGLGELFRGDEAAQPVVGLHEAHPPACAGQFGGGDEPVDARPDDDRVVAEGH